MSGRFRAWQVLLPVWLPVALLCLLSVMAYVWLSSESFGRKGTLNEEIERLEASVTHLEKERDDALAEVEQVARLDEELDHLYEDVFGSLDERLTATLRAVGSATRDAGLLPSRFAYGADSDDALNLTRFSISFSVFGQYAQIRRMLSAVQASDQFLIVEHIGFSGEEGVTTTELRISVKLATYFAYADQQQLDELLQRSGARGGR
jgi:Tfp pilus assembly protein PilO